MNDTQNGVEKTTYPSMKALSNAQGIPIIQLRTAKRINAPGFNPNNTINWKLFGPWYAVNKHQLIQSTEESYEYWRIVNAKKDAEIKDEQLKRLRKESLDPKEVISLLQKIKIAQHSVFTAQVKKELPRIIKTLYPDIDIRPLDAEADKFLIGVFEVFNKEFEKWMKE